MPLNLSCIYLDCTCGISELVFLNRREEKEHLNLKGLILNPCIAFELPGVKSCKIPLTLVESKFHYQPVSRDIRIWNPQGKKIGPL